MAATLTPQPPRRAAALLCLAACAGAAGCGSATKLAAVSGQVTYEGKAVPVGASVLFADPARGVHIVAKLDAEGRYRVEMAEGYGLPPGTYGVAVLPPLVNPTPEMLEQYRAGGPPPELAAFAQIPLRYRKPETSKLTLDLTPDGAVFDIRMTP